ncbi:MAG: signal peptide peptidase SppA [Bacteroidales bacterium]|nr:signal peptide peptidase SppA [Bacteroidales bacterium]
MKEFLKTFAAVVLGTALVLLVGFFLILGSLTSLVRIGLDASLTHIPDRAILYISFEDGVATQDSDLPVLGFLPKELDVVQGGIGFLNLAQAIRQAASDPSVRMIYMNPQALHTQMSYVEEIREALLDFRQSGKPVISYAGNYSQQGYYLATAVDKIAINPSGNITLQGVSMGVNYYKGLFDRLGIEAQLVRHGSFKTAGEPFTSAFMSREEKEQLSTYLNTAWEHWSNSMDAARQLESGTIDRLCGVTFLSDAAGAYKIGLVDELWHRDQMVSYLSDLYDGIPENKLPMVSVKQYIKYLETHKRKLVREKMAVVYMKGEITPGKVTGQVSSDTYVEQLARYRRDSSVKAVVVRIESPGGDPLAADMIARELELIKEIKPVVVSMGDVAASGGYWIASAAHEIFAHPFSMTGSIGVYSLLFNIEDGMENLLSIHNQTIGTHPFSQHYSLYHSKSKEELDVVQRRVDQAYHRFIEVVSKNRNMDKEEIEALANGRIWSGTQAVENSLVDFMGGLTEAIDRAAQLAQISRYRLVTYPGSLRITDLLGLTGEKRLVLTLLKEQGVRARLLFDEKALQW